MKKQTKESWIKDFDEKFIYERDQFIRTILAKQSDISYKQGKEDALDEAIAIFKKLSEDEIMTKYPVILELNGLKLRINEKTN